MPVRNSALSQPTLAAHKQLSYESLLASWLVGSGWEVLIPAIDHGKKTDLVIADDTRFYRIQVKSVETSDESTKVDNKWSGSSIDYVVYFSRSADWGYVAKPFKELRRRLNASGHVRFRLQPESFMKAFESI